MEVGPTDYKRVIHFPSRAQSNAINCEKKQDQRVCKYIY